MSTSATSLPRAPIQLTISVEVVLSSLIANFEFELSDDKPIFWNLAGLSYPSLSKDSPKSEMWLRVRRHTSP